MREGGSLAETLESRLAQWSGRTGVRVEIWALPSSDAPAPIARAVLTVLDDALANVEHHSGAGVVSIAVTIGRGGLRMTVSDHGRGFDPARTGPGIERMRAAFAAAGGSLSVNSVLGEGTTVTGVVPRRR